MKKNVECELNPAAQKMYMWLALNSKPEKEIEFSKLEFDEFYLKHKRKPLSNGWFSTSLKKLVEVGLIKMVKNYGRYTYKIIVIYDQDMYYIQPEFLDIKYRDYVSKMPFMFY